LAFEFHERHRVIVEILDGDRLMPKFTDSVEVVERGRDGDVILSLDEKPDVHIAAVRAGGHGYNGELFFSDKDGHLRLGLNSDRGSLNIWRVPNPGEEMQPMKTLTLHLSSEPSISLSVNGESTIRIDGSRGDIWLGGNGTRGDLLLFRKDGDNKTPSQASIWLDGEAGDIILQNADCAEEFDVEEVAEPGSTMVIGADGKLRQSRESYDRTVAGVVSGLGDLQPGIVLGRKPSASQRLALAVIGKVYCKVDATRQPIQVGDLLTTSARVGHAMKASDPRRAFGAVLGKALGPQHDGLGVIPVLVALH
jgi:hypothetical protein